MKNFVFLLVIAMYLSFAGLLVHEGHWIVGAILGFIVFCGVKVTG